MADKLSKANSAILSIVSQHQESNIETSLEPQTVTPPKNVIVPPQVEPISPVPQTSPEAVIVPSQPLEPTTNVITQSEVEKPLEAVVEPITDTTTAADLITALSMNVKKQRMIDRKKRVSYYFDPQTVEMVDVLSNRTGWDKYEIVELAVKELYRQVIKK